jgi:hypothetical protein
MEGRKFTRECRASRKAADKAHIKLGTGALVPQKPKSVTTDGTPDLVQLTEQTACSRLHWLRRNSVLRQHPELGSEREELQGYFLRQLFHANQIIRFNNLTSSTLSSTSAKPLAS